MELLTGIVLFNPELEILEKNIEFLSIQKIKVVLIDNKSENIIQIEKLLVKYPNSILIKNSRNRGVATALNQIMDFGKENKYNWCLLMDQDSELQESFFINLIKMKIDNKDAIITPKIIDNSLDIIYDSSNKEIEIVDTCITSGSINRISVWEEIGGFDEKLFIDGVDHDYCIRVTNSGYRIVKNNFLEIKHRIGEATKKNLFNYNFFIFHHNSFRKYYITRNLIYLNNKHNISAFKTTFQITKQYIIVLFFEKKKIEKIKSMNKGIRDGIRLSK